MADLKGALKMVEQVKNMPPWIAAVIALASLLGTGGTGFLSVSSLGQKLEAIEKRQIEFTRRLDSMEWRIIQNSNRLDGQRTKNREQDASLRAAEKSLDRLLTLNEMNRRAP